MKISLKDRLIDLLIEDEEASQLQLENALLVYILDDDEEITVEAAITKAKTFIDDNYVEALDIASRLNGEARAYVTTAHRLTLNLLAVTRRSRMMLRLAVLMRRKLRSTSIRLPITQIRTLVTATQTIPHVLATSISQRRCA